VKIKAPGAKGFSQLGPGQQIPVGTTVDARKGTVTLFTAAKTGGTDHALFYEGIFKVGQAKKSKLTTLTLVEKLACDGAGKADAAQRGDHRRDQVAGGGHVHDDADARRAREGQGARLRQEEDRDRQGRPQVRGSLICPIVQ
jgi:hypothetical protein